jgi:PTS system nitrogen regulatory IIA component
MYTVLKLGQDFRSMTYIDIFSRIVYNTLIIFNREANVQEILTLEEVAKYLRVSDRTVYEWAQKGEIPAGKIGTVWRFRRCDIEQWVAERLPAGKLMEPTLPVHAETILSPERVLFLDTEDKREALTLLSNSLVSAPNIKNRQEVINELFKREDLLSTAIGRGVAIPHVRLYSVSDIVVSVGINKKGIRDFHPLDDEPVRLILMVASAYNQHARYLQALSYFSARLRNESVRNALLAASDAQTVYDILCGRETPVVTNLL